MKFEVPVGGTKVGYKFSGSYEVLRTFGWSNGVVEASGSMAGEELRYL